MTKEELAEKLNNIQYPVRIDKELKEQAKANGLVIVYGASDDLMEFDGAVSDEVGCYDGGEALIDREGLLPDRESIDEDDELKDYFERKDNAKLIEALWCKEEDYSWTYKTDISHTTFNVKEGDEVYCRGMVFMLDDVENIPLKCTVTITGKKGADEANINVEFDPPILKEDEEQWDDSGAKIIVGYIMEALKEAKDSQE